MVVLVGLHSGNRLISNNTLYYRFLVRRHGILTAATLDKKGKSTADVFEEILTQFFVDKQLISVGYEIKKVTPQSEEYYGVKLENSEGEKLSIYYSSKALSFAEDINQLVVQIKRRDFYEYCKKPIEKGVVKRMTIRPGEEHSGVLYVFDNRENAYLQKRHELGIYYQESLGKIDSMDLILILNVIRLFINSHLSFSLYYKYEECKLFLGATNGDFIEMKNENLITAVERGRIIDDLWLLMHGLIKEMPTQEESMANKEMLRTLKKKYLKSYSSEM